MTEIEQILATLPPAVQRVAMNNAELVLKAVIALEKRDWSAARRFSRQIRELSLNLDTWTTAKITPSMVFDNESLSS